MIIKVATQFYSLILPSDVDFQYITLKNLFKAEALLIYKTREMQINWLFPILLGRWSKSGELICLCFCEQEISSSELVIS